MWMNRVGSHQGPAEDVPVRRELVKVYSGELASKDSEMIHEHPSRYKYRIAGVNQAGQEGI